MHKIGFFIILAGLMSCHSRSSFDIQGHRGTRGWMPENSIPGFIKALDMGVTTLELDVVVSKDRKIVVSHEPWFSHVICLDPEGAPILEEEEKNHNIFQMNYDQIRQFDCGSLGNLRFPGVQKSVTHKPLLSQVIDTVEGHIKNNQLARVNYNIEVKSMEQGDNLYHPEPGEFCDLVYQLVSAKLSVDRVIIQSFDFRILQYFHRNYPDLKLAVLIENQESPQANLEKLGFKPEIYSCHFPLLDEKAIKELQAEGIKVIPWTVNEEEDIQKLIRLGVDGIISDYPDRVKASIQ